MKGAPAMKATYLQPSIDIVRISSQNALLETLGISGDIHISTVEENPQSGNRILGRLYI